MVRHEQSQVKDADVLFVTPGTALRMFDKEPLSSRSQSPPSDDYPSIFDFETIIIDEFHERSMENDLLLATLKSLQKTGRNTSDVFHLVIMSATIDVENISQWIGAEKLEGEGRQYPVEILHLSGKDVPSVPSMRGVESRVTDGVNKALQETPEGDILVFLPGKGEIEKCKKEIARVMDLPIIVLHGGLSPKEQDLAFRQSRQRRVILATNVAESSVTLPWVRAVVDSGLEKRTIYRHTRSVLSLMPISQESADQRAGRAGRLGPGTAIRLWDKKGVLRPSTPPEIVREDLDSLLLKGATLERSLQSLKRGYSKQPSHSTGPSLPTGPRKQAQSHISSGSLSSSESPASFGIFEPSDFLQPPDPRALEAALNRLVQMNLLDKEGHLTETGERAARYPTDPMLSILLVEALRVTTKSSSNNTGLLSDTLDLVASLSVQGPFFRQGPYGKIERKFVQTAPDKTSEPLPGFTQKETEEIRNISCDGVARIRAMRGDPLLVRMAHESHLKEARLIKTRLTKLINSEGSLRFRLCDSDYNAPIDGSRLAELAAKTIPQCAFIQRGKQFGGPGMEVTLSPHSFVKPDVSAIAVLDIHSTRTKGFRATHIATCCLPLSPRDLAIFGLADRKLISIYKLTNSKKPSKKFNLNQGSISIKNLLGKWSFVYGDREIHTEEKPLKNSDSLDAAAVLIQQGSVLPGAYDSLTKALNETELFFRARSMTPPRNLEPQAWLASKLQELGLQTLEDLNLITSEDIMPALVDELEMESFRKDHPTSLRLMDRTLSVEYDFTHRKIYLIHESGRQSPPPSLFQLPKWPKWQIVYQVHSRKWNLGK